MTYFCGQFICLCEVNLLIVISYVFWKWLDLASTIVYYFLGFSRINETARWQSERNIYELIRCPPDTEIFSKRRKIYSFCVESMSWYTFKKSDAERKLRILKIFRSLNHLHFWAPSKARQFPSSTLPDEILQSASLLGLLAKIKV